MIQKGACNSQIYGQALLRHKSQITTATFYKKAVTPETLRAGIKMLEAAATGRDSKEQA